MDGAGPSPGTPGAGRSRACGRQGPGVRLTLLHPDPSRGHGLVPTDIEAEVGTALSALRPALARVSGYAGWASAGVRAAVADVVLDEHHVVGQPPLVEGCVLRPGPGSRADAELAVRADWHVAVVAGPDCGGLGAVPPDGTLTVHAAGVVDVPEPHLTVHDPTLPRVQVRRRGDRVRVRAGSGVRRRRWRPDEPLRFGATTLVLRGTPRPATAEAFPVEPGAATRPATWLASARRLGGPRGRPPTAPPAAGRAGRPARRPRQQRRRAVAAAAPPRR